MDFEVGSWTSSKKADDLTNKLFGQSFTKLKKSEKPLTGVLAEEEKKSKMKKKKKKGIVAAGGTSVQRPKAKTKEDAIALAKLRKNKKRKMKQKLARYHAKVQEQTETADSASSEKGKALGSKKQTKHKKGLKQKGTPSEKSDSSQSPKKSKIANGNSVITDSRQPKMSPKNKYKHLAQQRKAETSTEKAKTIKLDEKNTVQKVFNDDTKAKVRRKTFDDDSDDNALDNSEGGRTLPKMKAKKKAFSENNELTPHKKVGHSSAVDTNESDFVKKKKGTGQVSPLVGAKEALMKFKNVKKKSQDSSLIEVDGSKVEVVDLQAPSDSERPSKKQKFKRNREEIDGSVEPPQKRKKHKRQMTQDLVQLPLTTKQSKKGKFNLDKLNALLHKEPSGTSVRKEKAVASPETDPSKSLKDKMKTQLNAARFRFINEQLYTSTSEEAVDMMKEDPEAFNVYHEGFQAQVSKWPTNPVNLMIAYLKQRPKSLVVADLGCGDGLLAESVKQKVYSFDLVAKKKGIIACDIANVPLEDNAVDISIFCLSLMGTNLVDFILEAHRITKMGGMLLVAEVLSRFDKLSNFIRKMGKLGFTLVSKDNSNTMFVWMEFKKTGSPEPDRLPQLELAPCSYKKR